MVKRSRARLRILFIARSFWPSSGAAATVNMETARILANKGHQITLLGPNYPFTERMQKDVPPTLVPSGVSVIRFGPRLSRLSAFTISFIFLILRAIPLSLKTHVILCEYHHSHLGSLCAAIVSIITRKPLVIRVHDLLFPPPRGCVQSLSQQVSKWSTHWSFRRAKSILVPGDELIELCRQMYGLKKGTVEVSYNGVDTEKFNPRNRSSHLRQRIGSKHIIIFSGWIGLGRGLDVLFSALSTIRRSVPDVKAVITGDPSSQTSISDLVKLAERFGVSDYVQFTYELPSKTLPQYLASADIGIGELTQREANYGSTPLKIVEYMASGCAVVAGKGTACSRLVRDKYNALLTESADPADTSKKILLLFTNQLLTRSIRIRARKTAKKTFTWELIVANLEKKLQTLASANIRDKG